jgi:hypothetical protein
VVDFSWFLELPGKLARIVRHRPRRRPQRTTLLRVDLLEDRLVPTLLGQQLFPADYPWNQNIASAPVDANSAAIIAHIGSSIKIHPDWGDDSAANGSSPLYGIPYNVVHGNSTAKVNVIIDNYPGESDLGPVPIPSGAVIEGDNQNGPNPNGGGYNTGQRGDSHLIVWDEDNNIAYELFGVTRPSDPLLFPDTNGVELAHTDGQWHAAQETVWNMKTDNFRSLGNTSADAAGLSILAGLVRPDEGLPVSQGGQGAITHALRFTLPSGDVNPQYLYPASHMVNESSGSTKLPFGARLRLMNTPSVNTRISAMGPEAQIIAHAMQQYGLILADIGSAMYVTGTSASENASNQINLVWNMSDVLGLRSLAAGDFQVVNLTPQVTGLSQGSGSAGSTITVIGRNFSGAAGHLSVFFGNTPATGVTIVDDSHLTVVVPSGSGTVHVAVQSGINEIDPNSPGDNVNNPIFGYGVSAAGSADQFTYGGSVLSAGFLVADFPGGGVWRHSDSAGWKELSPAEASLVDVDDHGNVAAMFGNGLWRYQDVAGWQQLTPAAASLLDIAGNGIVVSEFPGNGVWRYGDPSFAGGGWQKLTPANALSIAVDDQGDTVASFQGNGVYLFRDTGGWQQLTPAVALQVSIAASGSSLAACFQGNGVWRDGLQPSSGIPMGWQQVTSLAASALAIDSAGDLLCVLNSGLWLLPSTGAGQQLTPALPSQAAFAGNGEVFAEFPGGGVWEYTSGWQQLTPADAKWLR